MLYRDHLSTSVSCRDDCKTNSTSTFDFIGGEDSGDEDSDELDDSDHLTEVEMSQSSFHDSMTTTSEHDKMTSMSKDAGAVAQDDIGTCASDASSRGEKCADKASSSVLVDDFTHAPDDSAAQPTRGRHRSGSSRSRGVQKMGRYMGKAVGGGISKVGHVGRSILLVGKSQGSHQPLTCDQHGTDSTAAMSAGCSFSSESQITRKYVCGYLHKVSDSKWGKKKSWHRRWFVLDRQRGLLSYYRHNPANHMPSSSHGNIVHMVDSPIGAGKGASSYESSETKRQSSGAPIPASSASGSSTDDNNNNSHSRGQSARLSESTVKVAELIVKERANSGRQQEADQTHEQQQSFLYLNETHPWYRGAMDLNIESVSLLFEKTLAKNAPTRYFFQVSTLSLHDIDTKRGIQYKVRRGMARVWCAARLTISFLTFFLPSSSFVQTQRRTLISGHLQ